MVENLATGRQISFLYEIGCGLFEELNEMEW